MQSHLSRKRDMLKLGNISVFTLKLSHSLLDTFQEVMQHKSLDSKFPYHKQPYTDQVHPANNIPQVRTPLLFIINVICLA